MKNIKAFTHAAGPAVEDLLAHIDKATLAKIAVAFQNGGRLSLSFEVGPGGISPRVKFELLDAAGNRWPIASCGAAAMTLQ